MNAPIDDRRGVDIGAGIEAEQPLPDDLVHQSREPRQEEQE